LQLAGRTIALRLLAQPYEPVWPVTETAFGFRLFICGQCSGTVALRGRIIGVTNRSGVWTPGRKRCTPRNSKHCPGYAWAETRTGYLKKNARTFTVVASMVRLCSLVRVRDMPHSKGRTHSSADLWVPQAPRTLELRGHVGAVGTANTTVPRTCGCNRHREHYNSADLWVQ
jgi:hypothetical protein